jgi:hypothetical protein
VTGLDNAIIGLEQALGRPHRQQTWRWLVRNRMSSVREALSGEQSRGLDAWLAAREGTLLRERETLLRRLAELGPQVLEAEDLDRVKEDLQDLVVRLGRHCQRINDLVYDSVSLELGGSE